MNSARKYINLMKQTMFYSKWAYEHEKYIGTSGPAVSRLPDTETGECHANQRGYFFRHIQFAKHLYQISVHGCSQPAKEADDGLIQQADRPVHARHSIPFRHLQEKGSMPVCMQEVLALYALNKGDMTINRFPVRKDVIERVKNFVAAVQPYANDLDTGAEAMKDYEDDYCYFLVFSKVFLKRKRQGGGEK